MCFLFISLFCGTGVWTQSLHLRPLHQPIFVMNFFFKYGLLNYLPRLASSCDPPDLWLLNSWDYRREPQHPALMYLLISGRPSINILIIFFSHIQSWNPFTLQTQSHTGHFEVTFQVSQCLHVGLLVPTINCSGGRRVSLTQDNPGTPGSFRAPEKLCDSLSLCRAPQNWDFKKIHSVPFAWVSSVWGTWRIRTWNPELWSVQRPSLCVSQQSGCGWFASWVLHESRFDAQWLAGGHIIGEVAEAGAAPSLLTLILDLPPALGVNDGSQFQGQCHFPGRNVTSLAGTARTSPHWLTAVALICSKLFHDT
jgi:hypothetical protein